MTKGTMATAVQRFTTYTLTKIIWNYSYYNIFFVINLIWNLIMFFQYYLSEKNIKI